MTSLTQRKNDHLDIVLNRATGAKKRSTGFEKWRFEHCALPELNLDDIDLSSSLFGRRLQAPLLISSMTGGARRATAINQHLAEAAQALGLAMGVGSQRVALESDENQGLTRARYRADGQPRRGADRRQPGHRLRASGGGEPRGRCADYSS